MKYKFEICLAFASALSFASVHSDSDRDNSDARDAAPRHGHDKKSKYRPFKKSELKLIVGLKVDYSEEDDEYILRGKIPPDCEELLRVESRDDKEGAFRIFSKGDEGVECMEKHHKECEKRGCSDFSDLGNVRKYRDRYEVTSEGSSDDRDDDEAPSRRGGRSPTHGQIQYVIMQNPQQNQQAGGLRPQQTLGQGSVALMMQRQAQGQGQGQIGQIYAPSGIGGQLAPQGLGGQIIRQPSGQFIPQQNGQFVQGGGQLPPGLMLQGAPQGIPQQLQLGSQVPLNYGGIQNYGSLQNGLTNFQPRPIPQIMPANYGMPNGFSGGLSGGISNGMIGGQLGGIQGQNTGGYYSPLCSCSRSMAMPQQSSAMYGSQMGSQFRNVFY